MLRQMGPSLLQIRGDGESEFLVLLEGGNSVSVLAPDLSTRKVSPSWVRSRLVESLEEPLSREVQPLLELAGIPQQRRERARAALIRERLREQNGDVFLEIAYSARNEFCPPGASGEDSFPVCWLDRRVRRRICALDSLLVADRKREHSKASSIAAGCWRGPCFCSQSFPFAYSAPGCRVSFPLALRPY